MRKPVLALAAIGAVLAAAPALAGHDRYAGVFTDSNHHYLDYKTSISEAKRELRKDLEDADSDSDRVEAYAEYERELADADYDFRKEMAERGIKLRRGEVTVLEDVAEYRR